MSEIAKSRKQELRASSDVPSADAALIARHRANERALMDHMEEFVKVGTALADIRESKSYRLVDGYSTFEDYCKVKWELGLSHVYRLMDASELCQRLPDIPVGNTESSPIGELSWNEWHMRHMLRLKSPTKAAAVAKRIVKEVKDLRETGEPIKLGSIVRRHVEAAMKDMPEHQKDTPSIDPPMFSEVVFGWTNQIKGMTAVTADVQEEDLRFFGEKEPQRVKDLADAIDGLIQAWRVAGLAVPGRLES